MRKSGKTSERIATECVCATVRQRGRRTKLRPDVDIEQFISDFDESNFSIRQLSANVGMSYRTLVQTLGENAKSGFPESLYDNYCRAACGVVVPSKPWLERLYSVSECGEIYARVTGNPASAVRNAVFRNLIPHYRFGTDIRIRKDDIVNFIKSKIKE